MQEWKRWVVTHEQHSGKCLKSRNTQRAYSFCNSYFPCRSGEDFAESQPEKQASGDGLQIAFLLKEFPNMPQALLLSPYCPYL